jgi:hypothetical protein
VGLGVEDGRPIQRRDPERGTAIEGCVPVHRHVGRPDDGGRRRHLAFLPIIALTVWLLVVAIPLIRRPASEERPLVPTRA